MYQDLTELNLRLVAATIVYDAACTAVKHEQDVSVRIAHGLKEFVGQHKMTDEQIKELARLVHNMDV